MNNAEYQDLPGISSHGLIAMRESPAHCWRKYLDPQRPAQESTAAMNFGTMIHCLALTPHEFDNEFLVADYERRSRAGKARYAQLQQYGLTVIKPEELEKAKAIVAALHAHPEACPLLRHGRKERVIIQPRANGLLPLKARLDVHHEAQREVVELKTTWSLQIMKATLERYNYPVSAAFYADISQSRRVIFIFVQTREPIEIEILELPRWKLQEGREQFQTALQRFDECWRANHWPEAEPAAPAPDLDDDPLMISMPLMTANASRQRFDLPLGELAL